MTPASPAGSPDPVLTPPAGGTTSYSVAEAAEILGAGAEWMRRNASTLPHRRYGRRIRFEVADLEEIRERFRRAGPKVPGTAAPLTPTGATARGRRMS